MLLGRAEVHIRRCPDLLVSLEDQKAEDAYAHDHHSAIVDDPQVRFEEFVIDFEVLCPDGPQDASVAACKRGYLKRQTWMKID